MSNKQQVIYIHGGESFETNKEFLKYLSDYDLDISQLNNKSTKWNRHLDIALGGCFELIEPQMPNVKDSKFEEWKIWFEKVIPQMNEEVVLIGNSLGGTFLLQYLARNQLPVSVKGLFLVAPAKEEGDMRVPEDLELVSTQVQHIYFYHSTDDKVVPFEHSEWLHKKIPDSTLRVFEGLGHFTVSSIPELYTDIRKVTKTRWEDFASVKKIFLLPVTGVLVDGFFEKVSCSSHILKEILDREGVRKSQAYLASHYLNTAGKSSFSQFREAFEKFDFELEKVGSLASEAEEEYRQAALNLSPVLEPGILDLIEKMKAMGDRIIVLSISSEKEIERIKILFGNPEDIVFFSKEGILDGKKISFDSGEQQIEYIKEKFVQDHEMIVSIGTAVVDIEKANNAGVISVAIPYATDEENLRKAKPCFVMESVQCVIN